MFHIFTIGHSTRQIKDFLDILSVYKIELLADIRSIPYSNYASSYNQPHLRKVLQEYKIEYLFLGDLLGGRLKDLHCYTKEGYWDYEGFVNSKEFKDGVNKLLSIIEKKSCVLMCTEFDPMECHRSLIIGRYLADKCNVFVDHIISKDKTISQRDLEDKLKNTHFPDTGIQYSFFSESEVSIEKAYEKQIREIFKKLKKVIQG